MSLAMTGGAVVFFTLFAFWAKSHWSALFFMCAAGSSAALGFQWFDVYVTNFGLTVAMMFLAYSLVCIGLAFKCLFWKGGDKTLHDWEE